MHKHVRFRRTVTPVRLFIALILMTVAGPLSNDNAQTGPALHQTGLGPAGDGAAITLADLLNPNPCTNSLTPTSASYGSAGGAGAIRVTTGSSCTWTAISDAAWITITEGSSGMGTEDLDYFVAANTTTNARTGTLTIGGNLFPITESPNATQLPIP